MGVWSLMLRSVVPASFTICEFVKIWSIMAVP